MGTRSRNDSVWLARLGTWNLEPVCDPAFPQRWLISGSGGTPFRKLHTPPSQGPPNSFPATRKVHSTLDGWRNNPMKYAIWGANENEHHLLAAQQTLHVFVGKFVFIPRFGFYFLFLFRYVKSNSHESMKGPGNSPRYLINAKAKPSHFHFHIMIMMMLLMMMQFTYLKEIKRNKDKRIFFV